MRNHPVLFCGTEYLWQKFLIYELSKVLQLSKMKIKNKVEQDYGSNNFEKTSK